MDVKDLKFVRFHSDLVTDPNGQRAQFLFKSIPRKLWEVKEGSFKNIDALYSMGAGIVLNPNTYLYVLVDDQDAIHGILWFIIDRIEEQIFVLVFAIDKECQKDCPSRGVPIFDKIWDFLRGLNLPFSTVKFDTYKPNAYEKLGAHRSKKVAMEIDLNVERPNRETAEKPQSKEV